MKKKNAIILIIILIILLGVCVYCALNLKETPREEEEVIELENEPKKDEPYKNETTLKDNYSTEEEKEVELKYDQYITANGYSGAADNVYYTRNGVLYHLIISTNQTIKLAEGVIKIENDLDGMMAYKGKNFKLIKEDEYVTYID